MKNKNLYSKVNARLIKAINEAMNVDFSKGTMTDDDGSVRTGTMSRGGWRPSVKQNTKVHKFGADRIQKELNNAYGPKYGNTEWNPET